MDLEGNAIAVVGLGNPGRRYEQSRHNAGYQVVDLVARRFSVTLSERKYPAYWGQTVAQGRKLLLALPTTYMNLSGMVVTRMLHAFRMVPEQMLVVHDDLDMPCGRIKLVQRGGAGGHRGVLSIIEQLGHQNFPRVKLGIGRPQHGEPAEEYVLKPPYAQERALYEDMIALGAEAVETVIVSGLPAAMNRFNRIQPGIDLTPVDPSLPG
ncbi:MAG TPA: aminoacyl-tRNA hydrolase [Syntrophobacteraceae bacterium]|jgi:peptidyl-tRNA hydrolase, PTH1 family|nr:aminoacyl-tRNA hydrolase [Syntrophobacteraceae bacterium]HBD07446.1 aminoacyl-tRNA hydrolase [Syntrophobacteraceae bacterium]HBZ56771.1 aminoacyl-tRNA hydrolase [Syntrophobacteraceae bacterium]